jgi:hypothetical protein
MTYTSEEGTKSLGRMYTGKAPYQEGQESKSKCQIYGVKKARPGMVTPSLRLQEKARLNGSNGHT